MKSQIKELKNCFSERDCSVIFTREQVNRASKSAEKLEKWRRNRNKEIV